MSCFFVKNGSIFLIQQNEITTSFNSINNALIEQHEFFLEVKPVKNKKPLNKNKHSIIKDAKKVDNYCNLCTDRLIEITKGCEDCVFNSLVEFSTFELDDFIDNLKKDGFYEVDQKFFEKEIETQKIKEKNKKP